ncbi:PA0069 family radical SAM protein [Acidisoma cellulosilytica]|uniref:PA0069 family radical SAM protein n=1 Tax=Acidisoma cellulosilyticum TaxID=2802395 RepID=A0A964E1U5_9PROT|nr:PA0069 family radical SAM protein [Acidisoma cellulosilyticum]MCB8878612.1 PA0069 family radical SAM protein [Acidisoma cellulosilyticum]
MPHTDLTGPDSPKPTTAKAGSRDRKTGPERLRITRSRAGAPADGGPPSPTLARSGRGATTNPGVRFETQETVATDDGWGSLDACFGDLPPLETTLIRDSSRTVIARNTSPDLGFDRSINPYRGCEHGCIYCFARPSHAYLGYSPGLDFETKLLFKPEVASLLEKELRKPSYDPKPITLGANTDPYQPIERRLQLTRQVLEVLREFGHPVSIVTKSALVLRDLDILRDMASRGLVQVFLSVTTLDPALARVMEPRASAPHLRLRAVTGLKQAGVPVGVLSAPMIPGLNDVELEAIIAASAQAGADRAGYVMLRLPLELREMFEAWLNQHVPARAQHVLSLIRQVRGGALYDASFGQRFTGTGAYADLIAQRFQMATRRHGLDGRMARLDVAQFLVPDRFKAAPANAAPEKQMSLF